MATTSRFADGASAAGKPLRPGLPGARSDSTDAAQVEDSRLIDVASSNRVINGVTTTPDGRMFVSHPQVEGRERRSPDGDRTKTLMKVNSVRVGLDGDLWVVDAGGTRVGGKAVPGAAKIVRIDVKTNSITRTYSPPPAVMREYHYFNDIRINGTFAYISDCAGLYPAIVVLNIETGEFRRRSFSRIRFPHGEAA